MRNTTLCFLSGLAIVVFGGARGVTGAERPAPQLSPAGAPVGMVESKHTKLSFELGELVRLNRSSGTTAAQSFAASRRISLGDGKARVVIQTRPDQISTIKNHIQVLGGTFEMAASDLVLARVPVSALEILASADEVKIVRRPQAPTLFQTISQGLEVIGAVAWHAAGRKGAGVKVAVLDVGFHGYQGLMGSDLPNIPANHVKSFSGDISGGGEAHGTGVAEIVYDMAPEADLYLVNASNEVELESAVDWLIDQRVDVINASWGYPCSGSLDGSGWVNELVKRAADAGILWIAAAGNYGQRHWSANFSDTNGNGWHNFNAAEDGNAVFLNAGDEVQVCVAWDDWTQKDQDYDLYVWNADATVVSSSRDNQSGPDTHDPKESLSFTASAAGTYYIGIKAYRATRNPPLHLYVYPPGTECAIEAIAAIASSQHGMLSEFRAFRDHVLRFSDFGTDLVESYYRHSPEVRRILLLHPTLAIQAAALASASRSAVRSVAKIRSGDVNAERVIISEEFVASVDRFFDQVGDFAGPPLRDDLREMRSRLALSSAAGQTADQYWEWLLGQRSFDSALPTALYPDPGYMHYTTAATSLVPPADSPHALTVGATNWASDVPEDFSSQGPTSDGRLKPDISAPDGVCTVTYGNCMSEGFSGTSAAAAHVTGAVALVRQVYPLASLDEIRNALTARAVDLSPPGPDNRSGAGRLSLGAVGGGDILPAPTLSAPSGGGAPIWPTFKWSSVSGAVSYRLMVAPTVGALPTDPASQDCGGCVINTTSSTVYYTPSTRLQAAATYYWQVQGRAASINGLWSARTSFTTGIFPELTPPGRTDLAEESGPWPAPVGKAVVITHGWNASVAPEPGTDQTWAKEMAEKMCGRLAASKVISSVRANALTKICQSKGWDIWVVDWSNKAAAPRPPWSAFANANNIGEMVASSLQEKNYEHIHFIAHSAGSNLINSATIHLKKSRSDLEIHDTFLDAYHPRSNASRYGENADWTDNYVDTRSVLDLHLGLDGTQLFLENGYNIDVTPGATDGCGATCRHSRPYRFYGRSVDASFVGDAEHAASDPIYSLGGTGYLLSTESDKSLSALSEKYKKGEGCVMIESTCIPQAVLAEDHRFNVVRVTTRTVTSVVGSVAWLANAGTSLFDSVKLGFASLLADSPAVNSTVPSVGPTEAPSYIVAEVTTAEPVDTLRFNWRLAAAGEAYLRVFVDGMLVREIDQRYVPGDSAEAEEIYIGGALATLPPGTHSIAFRLDGFGTSAAGVELTSVELGAVAPLATRRRLVRR